MNYLTASIPNSFLTAFSCVKIKSLTKEEFIKGISESDHYQDYDNNLAPLKLKKGLIPVLGHQNVCDILSSILNNGATLGGKHISPTFSPNRVTVNLQKGDNVFAFIFIPPRRLNEGEHWTQDDFNAMDIKYIRLYDGELEESDYEWRYQMTKWV